MLFKNARDTLFWPPRAEKPVLPGASFEVSEEDSENPGFKIAIAGGAVIRISKLAPSRETVLQAVQAATTYEELPGLAEMAQAAGLEQDEHVSSAFQKSAKRLRPASDPTGETVPPASGGLPPPPA